VLAALEGARLVGEGGWLSDLERGWLIVEGRDGDRLVVSFPSALNCATTGRSAVRGLADR